jgi:hypothetical protein
VAINLNRSAAKSILRGRRLRLGRKIEPRRCSPFQVFRPGRSNERMQQVCSALRLRGCKRDCVNAVLEKA